MKKLTDLTREQLLEIAELFVTNNHSEGWKAAEAKDLMSPDYTNFIEYPKPNWKEDITNYLNNNGFELPTNILFK